MRKTQLNVKGMHCPSCETLINDSLIDLDGVEIVETSHKKGTVNVYFDDSKIDEDKIKLIINRGGYAVE